MEKFILQNGGHIKVIKDNFTDDTYIDIYIKAKKKEFNPKNGDFLFEDGRIMIAKSYPSNYHALIYPAMDDKVLYNKRYGLHFSTTSFRYAIELEKQTLLDALEKEGKYWDEEEKCIKDIPKKKQRKFKVGDKVKVKSGISSKSHTHFLHYMDIFLGETLTIKAYTVSGDVYIKEDGDNFIWSEDWFEPYKESDHIDTLSAYIKSSPASLSESVKDYEEDLLHREIAIAAMQGLLSGDVGIKLMLNDISKSKQSYAMELVRTSFLIAEEFTAYEQERKQKRHNNKFKS